MFNRVEADLTGFFECDSIIFIGAIYAQITIKRGDIGFYEVSFCLAHLPRIEGVHKSSEMAAFAFSAPTCRGFSILEHETYFRGKYDDIYRRL